MGRRRGKRRGKMRRRCGSKGGGSFACVTHRFDQSSLAHNRPSTDDDRVLDRAGAKHAVGPDRDVATDLCRSNDTLGPPALYNNTLRVSPRGLSQRRRPGKGGGGEEGKGGGGVLGEWFRQ